MTVTVVSVDASASMVRGGAVCGTAAGQAYVVVFNSGDVSIYSINGSAVLEDSDTATTIFGTASVIGYGDAYMDSSDVIHIVIAARDDLSTYDIAYATFDTGTDTLSSWEEAASYTANTPWVNTDSSVHCGITVDSSDIPAIVYVDDVRHMGQDEGQVQYTKRTGGTWDTPELVNTAQAEDAMHPYLTICAADDIEVVWRNGSDFDLYYRRRNASWGTENQYTGSAWSQGVINEDTDTTYRLHIDTDNIYVNNTDTTLNAGSQFFDRADLAYADSLVHIVFYDNTTDDIQLYRDDGASGWELVEEIAALTISTTGRLRADYQFGTDRTYVQGMYELDGAISYWKWEPVGGPPRRIFVISHGR